MFQSLGAIWEQMDTLERAKGVLHARVRVYNGVVCESAALRRRIETSQGEVTALRGLWSYTSSGGRLAVGEGASSTEAAERKLELGLQGQLAAQQAAAQGLAFRRQQYSFMQARLEGNLEAFAQYLLTLEATLQ